MNGATTVIVVLLLATAFGLWRRHTEGRVRALAAQEITSATVSPFARHGPLGEHATIVQFSAAVCAPCRAATLIASEVTAQVAGVTHIEINAEEHMELVQAFGILRTPTLLVLDSQGRLSARITGVPRRDELLVALDDRRFEDL